MRVVRSPVTRISPRSTRCEGCSIVAGGGRGGAQRRKSRRARCVGPVAARLDRPLAHRFRCHVVPRTRDLQPCRPGGSNHDAVVVNKWRAEAPRQAPHIDGVIPMKRRTLDVLFSVGGVPPSPASCWPPVWSSPRTRASPTPYVARPARPAEHHVQDGRHPDRGREAGPPCLVQYAGQKMTTGKQAECYANNFIGLHLEVDRRRKDLRRARRSRRPPLRTQVTQAQQTNAAEPGRPAEAAGPT